MKACKKDTAYVGQHQRARSVKIQRVGLFELCICTNLEKGEWKSKPERHEPREKERTGEGAAGKRHSARRSIEGQSKRTATIRGQDTVRDACNS